MEDYSVNHENDSYKILKFINKSKFTYTDVDKENNEGLVHKCNSKHKCALCVNLKPSDSSLTYHSSLTHMWPKVMTEISTPKIVKLLIAYSW